MMNRFSLALKQTMERSFVTSRANSKKRHCGSRLWATRKLRFYADGDSGQIEVRMDVLFSSHLFAMFKRRITKAFPGNRPWRSGGAFFQRLMVFRPCRSEE